MIRRFWTWLRTAWWLRRERRAAAGGDDDARRVVRRALDRHLGRARGLPLKLAQARSLVAGEAGPAPATDAVEPWGRERIEEILHRELGDLRQRLVELSPVRAAASFGQVHEALLDGETRVAVKIQYPDMPAALRREMRLAGWLPGMGPMKTWGFDLDGYKHLLADTLSSELDYREEAASQEGFRRECTVRGVQVPRVHAELSTRRVLVQDWHQGVHLDSVLADAEVWRTGRRTWLGRQLLCLFLESVFVHGRVHADPNPGNYLFRPEGGGTGGSQPELSLLDFGCVLELDLFERATLLDLVLSTRRGDAERVGRLWTDLGYEADVLAALGDDLLELTRLIFLPFLDDELFRPQAWRLSEDADRLLGERRWSFRAAGPPRFLLLIRAFHGLVTQLRQLDAHLPWFPLLQAVVPEETLEAARERQPAAAPLASHATDGRDERLRAGRRRARLLRVCIEENGDERLRLALPAERALRLPEVVPEPVAESLERRGYDLGRVSREVEESGLAPRQLLRLDEGSRSWRVWLE